MIKTGIFHSFSKLNSCDGSSAIHIAMSKNESESVIISLLSDADVENISFSIPNLPEKFTFETEELFTVNCNGVDCPDPLVPVSSFSLKKDALSQILVRFNAENACAGVYPITVELRSTALLASFTVNIKVWNFALPEEYVVNASMDIHRPSIERMHNVTDESEKLELYKKYYDYILKFRVSPFYPPYDVLDERCDKYLDDPRLTAFILDSTKDSDTLKKYREKLSKHPKWQKKAMFYPLDEPTSKEHLDTLSERCAYVNENYPEVRRTSAFYTDIDYDKDKDLLDVILDNCALVLPKLTCFDDDFVYATKELCERKGSFQERINKAKAEGKEIWQYVCWEPGKPYVNLYVDESGLDHRVLFWQQHLVGATGFLYWCTTWWKFVDDPWTSMATVSDLSPFVFGDGSLLYNGNKVGIDGPCGSIRLETVRDGLEDAEMLLLADKYLGRDLVLNEVKKVCADLKNYTDSIDVFESVRRAIGDALEKAINN